MRNKLILITLLGMLGISTVFEPLNTAADMVSGVTNLVHESTTVDQIAGASIDAFGNYIPSNTETASTNPDLITGASKPNEIPSNNSNSESDLTSGATKQNETSTTNSNSESDLTAGASDKNKDDDDDEDDEDEDDEDDEDDDKDDEDDEDDEDEHDDYYRDEDEEDEEDN